MPKCPGWFTPNCSNSVRHGLSPPSRAESLLETPRGSSPPTRYTCVLLPGAAASTAGTSALPAVILGIVVVLLKTPPGGTALVTRLCQRSLPRALPGIQPLRDVIVDVTRQMSHTLPPKRLARRAL